MFLTRGDAAAELQSLRPFKVQSAAFCSGATRNASPITDTIAPDCSSCGQFPEALRPDLKIQKENMSSS